VRNYFGEKIAFYVHYLSFTTILLIIPAIIGIPAFVLQEVDKDEGTLEQVTNAIFAFLIVCWATTYYEFWKREEVKYTVIWGQVDFEEDQVERVDFHGIWRRSPVDDRREIYFSLYRRLLRIFLACLVTLFMIA
jgi:anoctamin-10